MELVLEAFLLLVAATEAFLEGEDLFARCLDRLGVFLLKPCERLLRLRTSRFGLLCREDESAFLFGEPFECEPSLLLDAGTLLDHLCLEP